jgi:riboflavin kinase/FMN adenylyltransferase
MRVIDDISDIGRDCRRCVLTIGNFDGVHLGHRQIISVAAGAARELNAPLVAMTFEPHPVAALFPEKSPGVLTPLDLKAALLDRVGIDCLFVVKSTPEVLGLSPEDFAQRFLVEALAPELIVEGEDFNFGAKRAGSIETLRQFGAEYGFNVTVVPPEEIALAAGTKVRASSTIIRKLIESGDVSDAARVLAGPYRLIGTVIRGRGKGRQLGFPTANLDPLPQIIPAEAVYAGYVEVGDSIERVCKSNARIPAALSVGRAQTLADDHPQLIEAHLLTDPAPDLLGKAIAMDFVEKIRDQHKFESEDELKAQIATDCREAAAILK